MQKTLGRVAHPYNFSSQLRPANSGSECLCFRGWLLAYSYESWYDWHVDGADPNPCSTENWAGVPVRVDTNNSNDTAMVSWMGWLSVSLVMRLRIQEHHKKAFLDRNPLIRARPRNHSSSDLELIQLLKNSGSVVHEDSK